ncbi:ATP-binding protein [Agrobacterium tumefaciens]|uniref:sensor histidine kinase n=1 Tax=Agrobacterium tumefaciens TaxID=358 RepID=UPI00287E5734|nr:ATP-binding protein [Agrobacterium tumefaciens]MDS7595477.1 ATP-binding protein [Agrobacterium tumefaciens]
MYLLPMMSASAEVSDRQKLVFGVTSAALGFALQAFHLESSIPGLAPMLYAVGLTPALNARHIRQIALSATCVAMLSLVAIAIGHDRLHPGTTVPELLATWGTITAITVLLTVAFRLKSKVSALSKELEKERRRSQALFDLSPVALWEQDYTDIVKFVRKLRDAGVTSVAEHAALNPDFVNTAANLITTRAVNRAALEMLGAETEDELLGCLQKFLSEDTSPFIDVMQAVLDDQRCYEGTAKIRGPRGRVCTAYIAIRFHSRECGSERVIVGMMDVTERQQMISDLREANVQLETARRFSEMGILASTIAHELSQPITGVTMNAQTALRRLAGKADVESAIRSIELVLRDGRRAGEIIALTRSRMSSGTSVPAGPVCLDRLIEEVVQMMQEELVASGARVELRLEGNATEVAGPRVELQQILVNLLSNAVHSVRDTDAKRKRVVIKTQTLPSGEVSVQVSDNGAGISEHIADRLFAPLVTTKKDGMGLGLSIAKSAVERRGGRIKACNNPGGGAAFEFTLPEFSKSSQNFQVGSTL